jgi:hypothetical protein
MTCSPKPFLAMSEHWAARTRFVNRFPAEYPLNIDISASYLSKVPKTFLSRVNTQAAGDVGIGEGDRVAQAMLS